MARVALRGDKDESQILPHQHNPISEIAFLNVCGNAGFAANPAVDTSELWNPSTTEKKPYSVHFAM